jgi:hypothetical protein
VTGFLWRAIFFARLVVSLKRLLQYCNSSRRRRPQNTLSFQPFSSTGKSVRTPPPVGCFQPHRQVTATAITAAKRELCSPPPGSANRYCSTCTKSNHFRDVMEEAVRSGAGSTCPSAADLTAPV